MAENAFFYKRKSTDDKRKQALSLPSQDRSCREDIRDFKSFNVLNREIEEKRSAKLPDNRPLFTDMIDRISKGEANIIICWTLNRLARNAKEAGIIIDMVQRLGLKIITPFKIYDSASDIQTMYLEFLISNTYIVDLQRGSKRGLSDKVEEGKVPGLAPLGYLNTPERKQGTREILVDPERFDLSRKMWDLLLTGQYNPSKIRNIATNEWGLRQRNGREISKTKIYEFFSNIFYTGTHYYY